MPFASLAEETTSCDKTTFWGEREKKFKKVFFANSECVVTALVQLANRALWAECSSEKFSNFFCCFLFPSPPSLSISLYITHTQGRERHIYSYREREKKEREKEREQERERCIHRHTLLFSHTFVL